MTASPPPSAQPKTPFEARFEAAIAAYLKATGWIDRYADAGMELPRVFVAGELAQEARQQVDAYAERRLRRLRYARRPPPPVVHPPAEPKEEQP
jgi:hypothetical protein